MLANTHTPASASNTPAVFCARPRPLRAASLLILAMALAVLAASSQHVRPRQAEALLRQGDAQRADYLYLSAAASYRRAAQLDPRDAEPLLRLGEVYLDLAQYADAAQAFAAASQISGDTPEIHAGLARALAGQGGLAGAQEHWRQVIGQQPKNTQARLELARLSMARGEWDAARQTLAAALELSPQLVQAHLLLGQLVALDDPGAARAHFLAANADDWLAALDSSDAAYRAAQLGRLWLARGEPRLARRALERAVELEPAFAEARAYWGYTLDQLGEDGGQEFEHALQTAPDLVIAHYLWGLHLRQRGDVRGAQTAFEAALARDPSNAALMIELGLTALQERDYAGSETWLVKAAGLEPDNPAWAKQLAHFYLDYLIAVRDKGLPSAQQAVRLAPDDAEARDLLGWAHYLTGDLASARLELDQAIALDPRCAPAHYHLAAVLELLGQPDAARLHVERAASLDPAGPIGRRARQMLGGE